jgi:hypothetical protein
MSVTGYLQQRASDAVLSEAEKASISTSISTLRARLAASFGDKISQQFQFGSSTRGTILPRKMDDHSDIDYMIVFAEGGYTPQTYLDRLRRFVEAGYSSSDIKQSTPTIVLELNHIKFDLVPALTDWPSYKIPNGGATWQGTNPNDFNSSLETANKNSNYMAKPAIRLAKFWNASVGYVFDSFALEKWIIQQYYQSASNQRDYLFSIFDNMSVHSHGEQWRKDKVQRAKDIISMVRAYESDGLPYLAENEIKKLIPEK